MPYINHRPDTHLEKKATALRTNAPRDQRPPPLYTLLSNNSEMSKGRTTVAAFAPKANFLFVF